MAGLFTFTALFTENGNGMVAIGGAGWRHRDHFHLEWSVHVSLAKYSIELFKFGLALCTNKILYFQLKE